MRACERGKKKEDAVGAPTSLRVVGPAPVVQVDLRLALAHPLQVRELKLPLTQKVELVEQVAVLVHCVVGDQAGTRAAEGLVEASSIDVRRAPRLASSVNCVW